MRRQLERGEEDDRPDAADDADDCAEDDPLAQVARGPDPATDARSPVSTRATVPPSGERPDRGRQGQDGRPGVAPVEAIEVRRDAA